MRIVGGSWGGRRISAPPGRATRPTTDRVREAWMSAIQPRLGNARVADLFAGSGALGIESLSRGASHVTFVEKSDSVLRVLRKNLEAVHADPRTYEIVRADVVRYLNGVDRGTFDIALADPPYQEDLAPSLVSHWSVSPFSTLLCLEHRSTLILPASPFWHRRYGDSELSFFELSDA